MINKVAKIMEKVYGKYTGNTWIPKPYADNKSRYLWTDAFGVCNYLSLYIETKDQQYLKQAKLLIDNVHDTLGKDRSLKRRLGKSTDDHPLLGGLRIGKVDEEGERDGDGQYFHYLTKWMFALNRYSIITKDEKYNQWAIELAESIHKNFVYYPKGSSRPRMYWKISIDMSHPWVASEGHLDCFDGYVTYRILQQTSNKKETLQQEIKDMEKMVLAKYKYYESDDPLDLGECLALCHWFSEEEWAKSMIKSASECLEILWNKGYFTSIPLQYRLAFREFGTSMGVQLVPSLSERWKERVQAIHAMWEPHIFRRDSDITPIMYCTSLLQGGVMRKDYLQ